ncbi:MAG: MoaD/ThiS family protein [Isosphaeraceae bacterium]
MTIRVTIPTHLRLIAGVEGDILLQVGPPATQRTLIDALEARYPVLRGTIRDHYTQRRRPFLRFYACGEDHSLDEPDEPLPEPVASGDEPFLIIGGIAGG